MNLGLFCFSKVCWSLDPIEDTRGLNRGLYISSLYRKILQYSPQRFPKRPKVPFDCDLCMRRRSVGLRLERRGSSSLKLLTVSQLHVRLWRIYNALQTPLLCCAAIALKW